MTTKGCNKFATPKKSLSLRLALGLLAQIGLLTIPSLGTAPYEGGRIMTLLTKPINVLKAVVAVVILVTVLAPVTQAQSRIIESVTEDIRETRSSLGGGGSACDQLENATSPVRAGQRAFQHLVNRCGKRSELEMQKTVIGGTYWYGWSIFIPSDWQDTSKGYDIINQWATYPTPRNGNFPCGANGSLMHRGGDNITFTLQRQGDSTDIECTRYNLAKVSEFKGKWVDFVMHTKWTGNKDGFLKLWMKLGDDDYIQKINYTGRTFWNDEDRGPYFKMGVYKGVTNFSGPAPRVLYTDEYRLGDANSDFAEVAPGGSTTPAPVGSIRLEAEQMNLSTYKAVPSSYASGNKIISLLNASSTSGTASSTFLGSSGVYNVVIGYFDENDGVANLQINRQGTLLASLDLNQNLGSGLADAKTLVRKQVVGGVSINYGDKIEINGTADAPTEWARVDYIEFVPVP